MANRLVQYFLDSKAELKKVSWPTRNETIKYTILVVVISLLVAAFLGLLDYLFTIGFELLVA